MQILSLVLSRSSSPVFLRSITAVLVSKASFGDERPCSEEHPVALRYVTLIGHCCERHLAGYHTNDGQGFELNSIDGLVVLIRLWSVRRRTVRG